MHNRPRIPVEHIAGTIHPLPFLREWNKHGFPVDSIQLKKISVWFGKGHGQLDRSG